MGIKDTIKSLEEVDEKLKKSEEFEKSGVAAQKEAAQLRDESRDNLAKVVTERDNLDGLHAAWEKESKRKDDELRNRETTLASKQSDLERKIVEQDKSLDSRVMALEARTIAADKADRQNKEYEEAVKAMDEKCKSIVEFITRTL